MKPTASLAAATAVGLCTLLLASCGGGGSSGNGSASAAGPPDDEAQLEFAECMRENGVDVPDPQAGGGPIQVGPGEEGGAGDLLNDPNAQQAFEECQEKLGDVGPQSLSAEDRQELEDAALNFARCMREHGIDVPDPQVNSGPGGGMFLQQAGEDADSPAFQEAQVACEDELPQPPGGGPGGPADAG